MNLIPDQQSEVTIAFADAESGLLLSTEREEELVTDDGFHEAFGYHESLSVHEHDLHVLVRPQHRQDLAMVGIGRTGAAIEPLLERTRRAARSTRY